jgi:hypothetical protein
LQGRNAGWYLIDFARGRPINPACTPVGASAAWYQLPETVRTWRQRRPGMPMVALVDDAAAPRYAAEGAADPAVIRLARPVSPPDVAAAAAQLMVEAGQYITSPPLGDRVAPT